MKRLLIILSVLIAVNSYSQTKLSELPALGSIDETEYLYGYRSAISYRISSALFTAMMGDTADVVRGEFEDSLVVIRGLINDVGAGEYWYVGLGDDGGLNDDTYTLYPKINNPLGSDYMRIMLGADPSAASNSRMLSVTGTSYMDGLLTVTDSIVFGANTSIKESSGEMELMDNTGIYSLTDLLALPTSLSASWTLDANTYDWSLLNDDSDGIYTNNATNAIYIVGDLINAQTPAFDLGDSAWTDAVGATKLWSDQLFLDPQDTAVLAQGMIYVDTQDGNLYYYNGSAWDTLNGGTGAGAGVFTSGTPVADQLAIFTGPSTIGGNSYYTTTNIHISATQNTGFGSGVFEDRTSGTACAAFGFRTLEGLTSGTYNTGFGNYTLYNNTIGSYNTSAGPFGLNDNISGNNNISIGYFSGAYPTTLSNRLYVNSIDRTNILGDTTKSIIYGLQAASTADQELYLNANVHFSDSLELNGTRIGEWSDIAGSDSVADNVHEIYNSVDNTKKFKFDVSGVLTGETQTFELGSSDNTIPVYDSTLKKHVQETLVEVTDLITGASKVKEVTVNISSANMLAGDSLLILAAPGTGKLNKVVDIISFYDYGGTQYTSVGNSYIYSRAFDDSDIQLASCADFGVAEDVVSVKAESGASRGWTYSNPGDPYIGLNQPIWLQLDDMDTGNGDTILKVEYIEVDFN